MKQAICLLDDVSFLTYKKKYDILEVHEDGVMIIDDSNERCVLFDGEFNYADGKNMLLIDLLDQVQSDEILIIWCDEGIMKVNYKGLENIDEDIDLYSEVVKYVAYPEKKAYGIFLKGYEEWYSGMMDDSMLLGDMYE